jgi:3-dehydroquinate synthase
VKWDIVRRDVADQHIRKVLNFGHTIGHAVESAMLNEGVGLEHGYAVAFGMLVEGHYASLTGNLDPNLFQTFRGLIIKWYSQDYPTLPSWESILSYLKQDKKSDSEKISWFIPAFSSQFEKFTIKNFAELEVPYNQSVIDLIASRY